MATPGADRVLRGGTFNLRYGRNVHTVAREVRGFMNDHKLDFLCTQEGQDYFRVLMDLEHFTYFAKPRPGDATTGEGAWTAESGILVRNSTRASHPRFSIIGDGWRTVTGSFHRPVQFPRVTLDGWLRVGSLHLPTPTVWKNGHLIAPEERKDDYLAFAAALERFMKGRTKSRLLAGDWNEPPDTRGVYTPLDIAVRTGSKIACPTSRVGHGRIDYAMSKRCEIKGIIKDLKFDEGSDHEPVWFVVHG